MDLQRGAGGGLRELALFAGAGGGILAGQLCGDRTVCAVEWDAYAAGVLVRQQNAGHLPPFPVWDDVRTFDGRPWRGVADCVSGGFPCQDISVAGGGAGIDGERSGLWREFARVVREVEPEWVRVENSPALTSRGLGVVLGDLAALGFDARWDVLSAADCGAPHLRERIWIVARRRVPHAVHGGQRQHVQPLGQRRRGAAADADGWGGIQGAHNGDGRPVTGPHDQPDRTGQHEDVADSCGQGLQAPERQELRGARGREERRAVAEFGGWPAEPDVGRVVDGLATGLDRASRANRIRCLGNGQVPRVAAAAWLLLAQDLT